MKKEIRIRVYNKYNNHCAYCGRVIMYKDMQVDHLIPKARAHLITTNINDFNNLMPSCRRCNHYKRSNTLEQFRKNLKTIHKRIKLIYINKVGIDYGVIQIKPFDGVFYYEKKR
jgi:5-methylcytosine-specific restriction endonuclease McrA